MSKLVESLPSRWYCSQEIFLEEREKIFRRNWSFVCSDEELKESGQYVTAEISGQSVLICRDRANDLRGFLNLCRHRASPVCTNLSGKVSRFTCPYHAWNYDLGGQLLNAPGFDESLDKAQYGLTPVRVETWNNLVFACLDRECLGLADWLGGIIGVAGQFPAIGEMEFHVRLSNTFMANWKNYSDNSAEGYHLATVHPGLHRSLAPGKTRITAHADGNYVGFEVTSLSDGSPGYWIYKFPGLLLHFSHSSFNIERVVPLDPSRSRTERWFWFLPEVDALEREETVTFSNRVMDEDIEICGRVQKNLEAGYYERGVLSPEREGGTIFFQSCVRNALDQDG
ncbi:MAG: aromatic ring-hydroxylating dioxygenase subunit alpha [Gammaproteobacteria bacterium]|nr:aromatic ring-hydroxylating dioxygenase subunit alpha [Gammaproteobacteria bacterium]MYD76038.1 aromatic ring-hydroxylating dioxygenase subunit alpha [Gammaproteobacteria bacterium]MYJ53254.1 aromatic ring-hydroxylating dioxygenase subunit alpha [Gammaproteobacteria bacterium]